MCRINIVNSLKLEFHNHGDRLLDTELRPLRSGPCLPLLFPFELMRPRHPAADQVPRKPPPPGTSNCGMDQPKEVLGCYEGVVLRGTVEVRYVGVDGGGYGGGGGGGCAVSAIDRFVRCRLGLNFLLDPKRCQLLLMFDRGIQPLKNLFPQVAVVLPEFFLVAPRYPPFGAHLVKLARREIHLSDHTYFDPIPAGQSDVLLRLAQFKRGQGKNVLLA
jgi:hypothetical protein